MKLVSDVFASSVDLFVLKSLGQATLSDAMARRQLLKEIVASGIIR